MDVVQQTHRARTGILYGKSGSKKTSQLARLAMYYWNTYQLKTRLISSDGGGWAPFEDSGLIDEGIAKVFDISGSANALATVKRLSQGYWPKKLKNGDLYFASDDRCKIPDEVLKQSVYMVEGLTSIAALWKDHIANNAEDTGFVLGQQLNEDGYRFGSLQIAHYGLMQTQMYNVFVGGFCKLPVKYVWTTALVDMGEDTESKTNYYGPKSAGKASTFEIPSWFGECWHLDDAQIKIKKGDEKVLTTIPVAWMRNHKETNTGNSYLAKVRIWDQLIPEVEKKWPNGFIQLKPTAGLEQFYITYAEMLREYRQTNQKQKEKE